MSSCCLRSHLSLCLLYTWGESASTRGCLLDNGFSQTPYYSASILVVVADGGLSASLPASICSTALLNPSRAVATRPTSAVTRALEKGGGRRSGRHGVPAGGAWSVGGDRVKARGAP